MTTVGSLKQYFLANIAVDLKVKLLLFSDCSVLVAVQSYQLFTTEILSAFQRCFPENSVNSQVPGSSTKPQCFSCESSPFH